MCNKPHTYHRWYQFMFDVHLGLNRGNSGELATLKHGGGPYLPIRWKFVHSLCVPWGAGPLRRVVAKGYLRWSEGVSCRTSSQMWGSWYFPTFLLRDGSLRQIHMASLIVLVMLHASLPTMEKHFGEACMYWWVVLWSSSAGR